MNKLKFLLPLLLFSIFAQAQSYQKVTGRWLYYFFATDSALAIPKDTLASAPINSIAIKNDNFFYKKANGVWATIGGGGITYTGGYGVNVTGSVIKFDSAVARKVDTINAVNDSTFRFTINGKAYTFKFRGAVTSVAGRTGAVVIGVSDITGLTAVLNAKADQTALVDSAAAIRADIVGSTGVSQETLDDSTAAIRADFPTGGGSTDTSHLSDRINSKLDKNDSTALTGFTNRGRYKKGIDSVAALIKYTTISNDSVRSNQVSAIPFNSIRNKKVLANEATGIVAAGDSYTAEYGVSTGDGYISIFANRIGFALNNQAVSGSGVWRAAYAINNTIDPAANTKIITMAASFNDLRRSGDNVATYNKIKSCLRSVIANNLIETIYYADNAAISKYGSWAPNLLASLGCKSGAFGGSGEVTNTLNDSMRFTFSGDALLISYLNRITAPYQSGNIVIKVDDVIYGTYATDNTDGISDGSDNNEAAPGIIFLKNLGNRPHTITIVNASGNYSYIDYIATVKPSINIKPVLISLIPKMGAAGYAISPALATDAIFAKGDTAILSVINEFTGFNVSAVYPMDFYSISQLSGDNIHPTKEGYASIANAWIDKVLPFKGGAIPVPQTLQIVTANNNTTTKMIVSAGAQFRAFDSAGNANLTSQGTEVGYNFVLSAGYVQAYDRSGGAPIPLILQSPGGSVIVGYPDGSSEKLVVVGSAKITDKIITGSGYNYTTGGIIPIGRNQTTGAYEQMPGVLPLAGSFSGAGTATTTFTVTIGTTMANTTYKVNASPTSALSAALFYISNKTTTTFDVVYLAGLTGTVTFDWSVFP